MKKYIFVGIAFIIVFLTVYTLWFSYNHTAEVRRNLQTTMSIIKITGISMDYNTFAQKVEKEEPNLRVTIIDDTGKVLGDSYADINNISNHSNRPEFIEAQKKGYGEAIRKSETTGVKFIYIITKLADGVYIRLAQPIGLKGIFLLWLIIPILFLCLILVIFIFLFARNKQLEILRSEFVANVSHELKTPLTSIKGFAELVSTGLVCDAQKIKEYQYRIMCQSDRLLSMINDILQLSALEHSKSTNMEDIDLLDISKQVMENLKQFADDKNIIIQITGKGSIKAQNAPIYEMIYNLVDNSIKYGKNGGYVHIILEDNKISVKDDGIGILRQDQSRIFERFYRADKSRSSQIEGTGLGLSIVKHTAAKYGGKITLVSDVETGTEVKIEFGKRNNSLRNIRLGFSRDK
jgi:two-component system phosphate regulon sensor histidine kinase PhoR